MGTRTSRCSGAQSATKPRCGAARTRPLEHHPPRLGRDVSGGFGSPLYANEELVAEMTSAFVCASLGIVPTVRHADYIGSWLKVLREDDRAIVRAASAASKAADHLLAFSPNASEPAAQRPLSTTPKAHRRRSATARAATPPLHVEKFSILYSGRPARKRCQPLSRPCARSDKHA